MRNLILLAGAAALAIGMPAAAKPGKGGGNGKSAHSMSHKGHAKNARTTHRITSRDRNGNGILDTREGFRTNRGNYAGNVCPPGLANKTPACVPPGQAGRMFNQGQRIPYGYNYFSDYNDIPPQYRSLVPYSNDYRYIYRDDRVYVVDPTTRLVTNIIDLIL